MCASVTVRNTTQVRALWKVRIDYSGAPFNGTVPSFPTAGSQKIIAGEKIIEITPNNTWVGDGNADALLPGAEKTLLLCNNPTSTKAPEYSAATWVVTPGKMYRAADRKAFCRSVQIVGTTSLDDFPFYYGWSVQVKVSDLVDELEGSYTNSVNPSRVITFSSPDPGGNDVYDAGAYGGGNGPLTRDPITVTSSWMTALQGRGSVEFTVCALEY